MPNLRRFGAPTLRKGMAAVACASLLATAGVRVAATDVGYAEKADLVVVEGNRTLHLEIVPGSAMVRFQGPGNADSDSIRAGRELLSLTSSHAAAGELGLVTANDSLAETLAGGAGLAESLAGLPQVGFSGPVFKLGDRVIGASDRLVVQLSTGLSPAEQESLLRSEGLEPIEGNSLGFWTASVPTSDGYEVINKAAALQDVAGVVGAGVDWYSEYTTTDHTDTFNGTSAAAPMVSGVAGLVLSRNPSLTSEQVIDIVEQSARQWEPGSFLVDNATGSTLGISPDCLQCRDDDGVLSDPFPTGATAPVRCPLDNLGRTQQLVAPLCDAGIDGVFLPLDDCTCAEGEEQFHVAASYISDLTGFGIVNAQYAVAETIDRMSDDERAAIAPQAAVSTNDPLAPYQWHLDVGNQPDAIEASDIDAPEAWALTSVHPDLVVGVIDSGVAVNNPDLNVIDGIDPINNSPSAPQPESTESHGTSVAGVIAARGNNGYGGVGVAPGARIVASRVIAAPKEAGNPYMIPGSVIEASFRAMVDGGAWVINNSWGPALPSHDFCAEAPPPFTAPLLMAERAAIDYAVAEGRDGLGTVVVFAAGNDRYDAEYNEMLAKDRENLDLDQSEWWGSDERRVREAILCVSATNNRARYIFYSNFGPDIDVAGPSGDDRPDGLACADLIWTGGELGIVTDDINIFELGGPNSEYPEYANATYLGPSYGTAGFTGFYDWSAFEDCWMNDETNVFRGRGAYIPTKSGAIEVYPNVIQGIDGILTGTATVLVRDATDTVTQHYVVQVTGRASFRRLGNAGENERYKAQFAMKGSGQTSMGQDIRFTLTGKEKFTLLDGVLLKDDLALRADRNGFVCKIALKIEGAGNARTTARLWRSNLLFYIPEGSPEPTFAPEVGPASFGEGVASIYSPTMDAVFGKKGRFEGNAAVDYRVGSILAGGSTKASGDFAALRHRGHIKASASNGLFRATSTGFHNADANQPFHELIDITHVPSSMTFRTPASSVSIKVPDNLVN